MPSLLTGESSFKDKPRMAFSDFDRHKKRKHLLFEQRETDGWIERYKEITRLILPRMGRYLSSEANKKKDWSNILDPTGSRAHRIFSSGLMSMKSSKAKPWFKLTLSDKDLAEHMSVKQWLHKLTEIYQLAYQKSNTYRALQTDYDEIGAFGTGPCLVDRHFDNLLHLSPLTVGEYALTVDKFGLPSTLYREYEISVEQCVAEFGYKNCTGRVRWDYDRGNYDNTVKVCHGISPRRDRNILKRDALNMPFESIYWVDGSDGIADHPLRVSGYKRFPGFAPRWEALGRDSYGVSQGMLAIGMIKQLQHRSKSKNVGIDHMVKPTLLFPNELKGQQHRVVPGGIVYSSMVGNQKVGPLFDMRLDLNQVNADVADVRMAVDQAFFVDLFLMANSIDRSDVTAFEIAKKHEEKLVMLGPADSRLDFELYDPLIDLTFDLVLDSRLPSGEPLMPPPPPEVQGAELQVQYTSVMSQAQQLAGLEVQEHYLGVIGNIAAIKPNVVDKVDADKMADVAADLLGVDPETVVSNEDVALIRDQRAQREQQQQLAAAAPAAAKDFGSALKDATAPTVAGGGVSELLANIPGYN